VLVLENPSSHSKEATLKSGNITVKYFSPNVTALIQLMDQGVLENLKNKFISS
jgi:hypothetical protein